MIRKGSVTSDQYRYSRQQFIDLFPHGAADTSKLSKALLTSPIFSEENTGIVSNRSLTDDEKKTIKDGIHPRFMNPALRQRRTVVPVRTSSGGRGFLNNGDPRSAGPHVIQRRSSSSGSRWDALDSRSGTDYRTPSGNGWRQQQSQSQRSYQPPGLNSRYSRFPDSRQPYGALGRGAGDDDDEAEDLWDDVADGDDDDDDDDIFNFSSGKTFGSDDTSAGNKPNHLGTDTNSPFGDEKLSATSLAKAQGLSVTSPVKTKKKKKTQQFTGASFLAHLKKSGTSMADALKASSPASVGNQDTEASPDPTHAGTGNDAGLSAMTDSKLAAPHTLLEQQSALAHPDEKPGALVAAEPGAPIWYYVDQSKNEQGPFNGIQMLAWTQYFPPGLLLRRRHDTVSITYKDLLEFVNGANENPFLAPLPASFASIASNEQLEQLQQLQKEPVQQQQQQPQQQQQQQPQPQQQQHPILEPNQFSQQQQYQQQQQQQQQQHYQQQQQQQQRHLVSDDNLLQLQQQEHQQQILQHQLALQKHMQQREQQQEIFEARLQATPLAERLTIIVKSHEEIHAEASKLRTQMGTHVTTSQQLQARLNHFAPTSPEAHEVREQLHRLKQSQMSIERRYGDLQWVEKRLQAIFVTSKKEEEDILLREQQAREAAEAAEAERQRQEAEARRIQLEKEKREREEEQRRQREAHEEEERRRQAAIRADEEKRRKEIERIQSLRQRIEQEQRERQQQEQQQEQQQGVGEDVELARDSAHVAKDEPQQQKVSRIVMGSSKKEKEGSSSTGSSSKTPTNAPPAPWSKAASQSTAALDQSSPSQRDEARQRRASSSGSNADDQKKHVKSLVEIAEEEKRLAEEQAQQRAVENQSKHMRTLASGHHSAHNSSSAWGSRAAPSVSAVKKGKGKPSLRDIELQEEQKRLQRAREESKRTTAAPAKQSSSTWASPAKNTPVQPNLRRPRVKSLQEIEAEEKSNAAKAQQHGKPAAVHAPLKKKGWASVATTGTPTSQGQAPASVRPQATSNNSAPGSKHKAPGRQGPSQASGPGATKPSAKKSQSAAPATTTSTDEDDGNFWASLGDKGAGKQSQSSSTGTANRNKASGGKPQTKRSVASVAKKSGGKKHRDPAELFRLGQAKLRPEFMRWCDKEISALSSEVDPDTLVKFLMDIAHPSHVLEYIEEQLGVKAHRFGQQFIQRRENAYIHSGTASQGTGTPLSSSSPSSSTSEPPSRGRANAGDGSWVEQGAGKKGKKKKKTKYQPVNIF